MYFSVLVFLGLIFQAEALTYWLDSTCTNKVTQATIDEVVLMGKEGNGRLQDSNDQVMAAAFQTIFKVDKTNSAAYTAANSKFNTA